jgi:hypothetical protein
VFSDDGFGFFPCASNFIDPLEVIPMLRGSFNFSRKFQALGLDLMIDANLCSEDGIVDDVFKLVSYIIRNNSFLSKFL